MPPLDRITAIFAQQLASLRRVALPLAAIAAVCACATGPSAPLVELTPTADARTWPAPPETPRYVFAGELIGEQDFVEARSKVRRGAARLLRVIAGLAMGRRRYEELRRPVDGFVGADGSIFVVDMSLKAVAKFDLQQSKFRVWREAADREFFSAPSAIASDGAGGVLVCDAEKAEIIRLSSSGEPLGRFGAAVLKRPLGLGRDPANGDIYVADAGDHTVKKFSARGKLLAVLGGPGRAPGYFNTPTHVTFHGGVLYVADTFNFRIQKLTPDGEPLAVFGRNGIMIGDMARPKGVAVGEGGRIYVVESLYSRLLVFDPDGRLLMTLTATGKGGLGFYLPAGAWTDDAGRVYVADMFNGRIVAFQELTPLETEVANAQAG
ncbi:MAG: 6-bladed beta-propeller [Parvularculaceae bacterium]